MLKPKKYRSVIGYSKGEFDDILNSFHAKGYSVVSANTYYDRDAERQAYFALLVYDKTTQFQSADFDDIPVLNLDD